MPTVRPTMTKAQARDELIALAIQISFEAPEKFGAHGHTTCIERNTVRRIRDVLDAAGVDWRSTHRAERARRRDERRTKLLEYIKRQQEKQS